MNEFVVEFHDGSRDWVDPVDDIVVTDIEIRVNSEPYAYTYNRADVKTWTVRPYSRETTYDPIDP